MDRLAYRKLLDEYGPEGRIMSVYKVEPATRSLADFATLVNYSTSIPVRTV